MAAVAGLFRAALAGRAAPAEMGARLAELCPGAEFANGYVHGRPGHLYVEADD
jgi:hypothetical protein